MCHSRMKCHNWTKWQARHRWQAIAKQPMRITLQQNKKSSESRNERTPESTPKKTSKITKESKASTNKKTGTSTKTTRTTNGIRRRGDENPVKESLTLQPNKTQAEDQKIQRRGEWNRNKPNVYGHIMVTQLSPRKEKENTEKEMPEKKKSENNEEPPKEGKRYKKKNKRRVENIELQTSHVLCIIFTLVWSHVIKPHIY